MKPLACLVFFIAMRFLFCFAARGESDLGTHGFADSGGVKIHYVTSGSGPLLVLLHGFPDFWYSWRAQIPPLSKHFQVVAIDLRGYNERMNGSQIHGAFSPASRFSSARPRPRSTSPAARSSLQGRRR